MSKISICQYNFSNPCLTNNRQIAFLSDIHGDSIKLMEIIEILKKLRISIIFLGGDLIDSVNDLHRNEKIKELLDELAKTANIFIGIGNHDLLCFDKNSQDICYDVKEEDLVFWKELSLINNIHVSSLPINKATITKWSLDNSIDISALNLPLDYYWHRESYMEFEQLINNLKKIDINLNKFNILLCHSPKNIVRDGIIGQYLDYLKQFNLILSGHMHGGLVPRFLRKKSYGGGIMGPYSTVFPEHAYGLVVNNHIASLTSGGVTKIGSLSRISTLLNNKVIQNVVEDIYSPEIEILNFMKGEETIKKVKSLEYK